jgi:hypothetical protein
MFLAVSFLSSSASVLYSPVAHFLFLLYFHRLFSLLKFILIPLRNEHYSLLGLKISVWQRIFCMYSRLPWNGDQLVRKTSAITQHRTTRTNVEYWTVFAPMSPTYVGLKLWGHHNRGAEALYNENSSLNRARRMRLCERFSSAHPRW